MRLAPLVCLIACSQSVNVKDGTLDVTPTDAVVDPTGDDDTIVPDENQAPVADAGPDGSAFVADEVHLDGAASYDPDGDTLVFEWTMLDLPTGSAATLINETRSNPSFYADRAGVLRGRDRGERCGVGGDGRGPDCGRGPERRPGRERRSRTRRSRSAGGSP